MTDPPPISHVSTLAPATAVAFLDKSYVLSGHARFVNIIPRDSKNSTGQISQKRIFTRERIHGIRVCSASGKVVFWGGRRISVCETSWLFQPDSGKALHEAQIAPDWVLTATLLDDGRLLVVGAHNGLLIYDPKSTSWSQFGCGERTMLYSADLEVQGSNITVVGGTVFGEILIWRWRDGEATGNVWMRLRGHEGSVFSVRKYGTLVVSCSDDRSVRLWDLDQAPEELGQAVNTGMGSKETNVRKKSGNGCVAIGWGHQARPWKVACLPSERLNELTLVTVSEDLTARFWLVPKWTQQQSEAVSMQNFKTYTMHAGKNVWSFDIDASENLMVTGGNDGRVCLLNYSDDGEEKRTFNLETTLASLADDDFRNFGTVETKAKGKRSDNWRNYAFVDAHRFIATTEQGNILLHNLTTSNWKFIGRWEGLRNWGHSAAWEAQGLVALGDSNGYLRILDVNHNRSWSWEADSGRRKVDGVFVCPVDDTEGSPVGDSLSQIFRVLTSSLGPKTLMFHSFSLPLPDTSEEPICQRIQLEAPSPKCIVTAVAYHPQSRKVFVGTRTGDLAIYTLPTEDTSSSLAPTIYKRALSASDSYAITAISPTSTTVTTTTRSGIYSIHSLPDLRPLHTNKPTPSISQIEGLTLSGTSQSIYGFRALNFVTHALSLNLDTLTIPCGGAHRSWSFHPASSSLLWTQSSDLHYFTRNIGGLTNPTSSSSPPIQVLLPGLHGREIKTAAYNPHHRVLATGAEDTTIRLSFPTFASAPETKLRTSGLLPAVNGLVKQHSTGLMGLVWSPDGSRLISVGGMEEIYVWRVTVDHGKTDVGVVREAELVPEGEREVRIMAVDVVEIEEDGALVMAVGTSDGVVKLVRYTPPVLEAGDEDKEGETKNTEKYRDGKFTVLKEWTYGAICITQISLLRHTFHKKENGIIVLAAATDGCIFAYHHSLSPSSLDSDLDLPIWRERAHQNTVKCLTLFPPPNSNTSTFRILSGGDDGSISSLLVETKNVKPWASTLRIDSVSEAHAGAVIGITATRGGIEGRDVVGRVVTVGSEGQVKVWDGVEQGARVEIIEAGIADPGELVVLDGAVGAGGGLMRVAVCGVGIEVWDVPVA
ncbi:WD40 repeat-like protein [Ascodesmis nigricans]|uniref:WD40 repeat-like protein n=1 Tax=Ascodesmis nigricans TaxID=341454 RepID=A0A4S2N3L3_9PEZI|nr:WD40 repeat-like protein [Ascodesmis nigricans]